MATSLRTNLRSRFGLGIDQLWIVAVLASFSVIVALMPLIPNDFWWHLKLGEQIAATGRVPGENLFGWTLPEDYPFLYGAWLSELLFFKLYQAGGIALILFFRNFLTVAAFALIGWEARRQSGSWRIAGLVTLFACGMASNNVVMRPQIFAWLPFVGFYILLSRYTSRSLKPAWLLLCPVLMAFWVNVHGSFVLGLVLPALFIGGEILSRLLKQERALTWREIGWLGGAGALTLLATLINPVFHRIFGYVLKLMTDAPSQQLGPEWQSPAPNNYPMIMFFLSILVLMLVLAYAKVRLTPSEILLILGFLWLAWSGMRYVVWFGLVITPVMGKAIQKLIKPKPWVNIPPKTALNLILAIALWVPSVAFQPWWIERLPLPEAYLKYIQPNSPLGPLIAANTPVEAVEYLRQHPGGKLFNEMGYGSFLIWALPGQKVFCDPRVELYPYDLWLDYLKVVSAIRPLEILEEYGVERVFIDIKEQEDLIAVLKQSPAWRMEYEDTRSQIWIRLQDGHNFDPETSSAVFGFRID